VRATEPGDRYRRRSLLGFSLLLSAGAALLCSVWTPALAPVLISSALLSVATQHPASIGCASVAAIALLWTSHFGLRAVGLGHSDTTPIPAPYAVISVCIALGGYVSSRWIALQGRRLRVAGAAASCAADLLRRNTRRLQALLDSTFDPLLLIDATGNIQAAGTATDRIFGLAREKLNGQSVKQLLPDFDLELLSTDDGSSLRTGWAGEFEGQRADGTPIPCEIALGCVGAADEEPDAERLFLLHVRDLTLVRERELERFHSHKMESIGQLAAGIAHEINTPTQYVSDNLRYLERVLGTATEALRQLAPCPVDHQDDLSGAEDSDVAHSSHRDPTDAERNAICALHARAPEAIREALEGVAHISGIVRTVGNFAHPDSSASSENCVEVDVNQAIHDTLAVARNEWKHVAHIELDLESPLPPLAAVPGEIHQVLLNLLVNAAHAMADRQLEDVRADRLESPKLDSIRISTRHVQNEVRVEIEDSGTGIPSDIQSRIFDPFFTTKPVGKGTGQGLAITHAIVRRHGGSIACQSREGQGTRFSIRLPLQSPASDHSS